MRRDRDPTTARRMDIADRLHRARERVAGLKRQIFHLRSAAQRGDDAAQRVLDSLERDLRAAEEDAGWAAVGLTDLELASDPGARHADAVLLEPDEADVDGLRRVLAEVRAL